MPLPRRQAMVGPPRSQRIIVYMTALACSSRLLYVHTYQAESRPDVHDCARGKCAPLPVCHARWIVIGGGSASLGVMDY